MSQENVDAWRHALEVFLAGSDEPSREAMLADITKTMDPEIEWDASELAVPDIAGVYRGKDAVLQWWRDWLAAWETTHFEYELVDAGDRVVLLLDQRLRGRSTGIEVTTGKYAHVGTFRNGLMSHWKVYGSQEQALEAVGLPE